MVVGAVVRGRLAARAPCVLVGLALVAATSGDLLAGASSALAAPPSQTLSGFARAEGIEAQVAATLSGATTGGTLSTSAPGTVGGGLTALSPAEVGAGAGTARVIVSADGANVYATDRTAGLVSIYTREADGALGGGEQLALQGQAVPEGIVESPDGKDVYVADFGTDSVTELRREAGGKLSEVGQTAAGEGPIGITLSPDGAFLYVADSKSPSQAGAVSVFARDPGDGTLTPIQEVPAEANAHDVLVSPEGSDVYVADYATGNISEYERHEDGTLAPLAAQPTAAAGNNPHAIALSPDGRSLYVADNELHGQVVVLARNTDGTLSPRETVPAGEYTENVAVSNDGDSVYATAFEPGSVWQFARDTATGALAPIAGQPAQTGADPEGVAVSPDGSDVYVADSEGGTSGGVSQYARTLEANVFEGAIACMRVGGPPGTGPVEVSVEATGSGTYAPGQGQAPVRLPGSFSQRLNTALSGGGDGFALLSPDGRPATGSGAPACEAGPFAGLREDMSASPLEISTSIVAPRDGTIDYSGSVTLSGASEPGASVSIYEGPTLLATSEPAGADGEWSQTLSGLALGTHVLQARDVSDGTAPSNMVELEVRAPASAAVQPPPVITPPAPPAVAPVETFSAPPTPVAPAPALLEAGVARLLGQGIVLDLRSTVPERVGLSAYVKVAGLAQRLPLRGVEATLFENSRRIPLQASASTLALLRVFRREHRLLSIGLTIAPHGAASAGGVEHAHERLY